MIAQVAILYTKFECACVLTYRLPTDHLLSFDRAQLCGKGSTTSIKEALGHGLAKDWHVETTPECTGD